MDSYPIKEERIFAVGEITYIFIQIHASTQCEGHIAIEKGMLHI